MKRSLSLLLILSLLCALLAGCALPRRMICGTFA